jgi:hypothetical protein
MLHRLFDGDDSVAEIAYRASVHAGIDSSMRKSSVKRKLPFEMEPTIVNVDLEKRSERSSRMLSSGDVGEDPFAALPKVHFR